MSKLFQRLNQFYLSFRRGYMGNKTLKLFQNYLKIILFHIACWKARGRLPIRHN